MKLHTHHHHHHHRGGAGGAGSAGGAGAAGGADTGMGDDGGPSGTESPQIMQALQQIMQELGQLQKMIGGGQPPGGQNGKAGPCSPKLKNALDSAFASGDPKVPSSLLGMLNHPGLPGAARDLLRTNIADAMPQLAESNPDMFNQLADAFSQVSIDEASLAQTLRTVPPGTM